MAERVVRPTTGIADDTNKTKMKMRSEKMTAVFPRSFSAPHPDRKRPFCERRTGY